MGTLSFLEFLGIVNEDAASDVVQLQTKIGAIDAMINQRTQPLLQQKTQLQKMLAIKQKQQQDEVKRAGNTATPQQPVNGAQQPAMTANRTTTPGGSGSGTPGGQAPTVAPTM